MDVIIKNKICHIEGHAIVKDNSDLKLNFVFDDEWEGKEKTARFVCNDKEIYSDVSIVNNQCTIPISVLEVGIIKVGVFNSEMSTLYANLIVLPSILYQSKGCLPDTIPSGVVMTSDGYVVYTADDYIVLSKGSEEQSTVTEYIVTSVDNEQVYTSDDYLVTIQD